MVNLQISETFDWELFGAHQAVNFSTDVYCAMHSEALLLFNLPLSAADFDRPWSLQSSSYYYYYYH